jgi:predicted RNase H-like HicB family nuclease
MHKDPDSDYGVTVPDLPGCFSAGETVKEALANAKEAIECHLEGMLKDSEIFPGFQAPEVHRANPDFAGGIWDEVQIDFPVLFLAEPEQTAEPALAEQ